MIGLVLHFPFIPSISLHLVAILMIFIYSLLYLLSVFSDTVFNSMFLYSLKVMRILLYVSSLTYTSILLKALNDYGLSVFQSTMLVTSIVLIFQAISANLDHILISTWKITMLDLHTLILTIVVLVSRFTHLNVGLSTISPTANSKELTLVGVFVIIPLIAYAYGYASAIDKLATLTPCYDNKSLLAVIVVTTAASLLILCTQINELMSITYYASLFIVFCYCMVLVIANNISNRKKM